MFFNLISIPARTLLNDLWSYYKFDSDATDSYGGNDGTVDGATLDTGKINDGYLFDGVDNVIEFAGLNNFDWTASDFSFAFWGRVDSNNGSGLMGLFSNRYDSVINWITLGVVSSQLYLEVGDGSVPRIPIFASPIGAGWIHYGISKSGSIIKLYINGSLHTTYDIGVQTVGDIDNLGRAGQWYVSGQSLDGMIDELGIWKRKLTASEFTLLYNSGTGLQYPF